MKWTTIPRNTTEVRLKQLFLHSNPNKPPPEERENIYRFRYLRGALSRSPLPLTRCKLTYDFPNAHHDARNPDQALGCSSKLGGSSDARPIDPAVEGQLQAWTTARSCYSRRLPPLPRHATPYIHVFSIRLTAVRHAGTEEQDGFILGELQDGF